jgi:hypothetical protein
VSNNLVLDTVTKQRVIERLVWSLRAFHDAEDKTQGGFESVSWRGQLAGSVTRSTLSSDQEPQAKFCKASVAQTTLGFPHAGPVTDSGDIFGMDSEAAPGL